MAIEIICAPLRARIIINFYQTLHIWLLSKCASGAGSGC
jgi:hypothetical protein